MLFPRELVATAVLNAALVPLSLPYFLGPALALFVGDTPFRTITGGTLAAMIIIIAGVAWFIA